MQQILQGLYLFLHHLCIEVELPKVPELDLLDSKQLSMYPCTSLAPHSHSRGARAPPEFRSLVGWIPWISFEISDETHVRHFQVADGRDNFSRICRQQKAMRSKQEQVFLAEQQSLLASA